MRSPPDVKIGCDRAAKGASAQFVCVLGNPGDAKARTGVVKLEKYENTVVTKSHAVETGDSYLVQLTVSPVYSEIPFQKSLDLTSGALDQTFVTAIDATIRFVDWRSLSKNLGVVEAILGKNPVAEKCAADGGDESGDCVVRYPGAPGEMVEARFGRLEIKIHLEDLRSAASGAPGTPPKPRF